MFIYPYKAGSESAKALSEALNIKRIRRENSKFKPSPNKTVINWGASELPEHLDGCSILNTAEAVANASNKIKAFEVMRGRGVIVPPFTTNRDEAARWVAEGNPVVCRTVLNGHSGEGIVIADTLDQLVDAPLYTMYKKKKHEYRLHFAFGSLIDQQRKARNRDNMDEEVNWRVRNLDNGFIFVRENVNAPIEAIANAREAMDSIGLDFGAVDVIHNVKDNMSYVLEINTAPGLKGTTLENYRAAFENYDAGMYLKAADRVAQNQVHAPRRKRGPNLFAEVGVENHVLLEAVEQAHEAWEVEPRRR